MAEYSKEWCDFYGIPDLSEFSIHIEFSKLELGESIPIICEGFGVTHIVNQDCTCCVVIDGSLRKFQDVLNEYKYISI